MAVGLLASCGPGHLAESTGTSTGGSTDNTAGVPTTGDPVVTSGLATTGGTTSGDAATTGSGASGTSTPEMTGASEASTPEMTGAGETSTTEPAGTGTSSTGEVPCEDTAGGADAGTEASPAWVANCTNPQIDWFSDHSDCLVDCSTMTEIHGAGPAAGLPTITQVAFGVTFSPCVAGLTLQRMNLGSLTKPQFQLYPNLECGLDPWLGEHAITGQLPDATPIEIILKIDSYAGDWVSEDPIDPPRLFGSFSGDLVGPFEAIHCSALDKHYNCG